MQKLYDSLQQKLTKLKKVERNLSKSKKPDDYHHANFIRGQIVAILEIQIEMLT